MDRLYGHIFTNEAHTATPTIQQDQRRHDTGQRQEGVARRRFGPAA